MERPNLTLESFLTLIGPAVNIMVTDEKHEEKLEYLYFGMTVKIKKEETYEELKQREVAKIFTANVDKVPAIKIYLFE